MGMVMPPQAPGAAPMAPPPQMQQPPAAHKETPRTRPAWMTDGYLLTKFDAWDKSLASHWGKWDEESKLAYEVTAGRQWDKDALEDAVDKSLTIVSINSVDSTVSAICGSEMTNRQEVRYYPREVSTKGPDGQRQDVVVNEILTSAAEWVRDECDASDEESEAFRDVIICGLGFTETRMDYEIDSEGMAIVERVDPLQMKIDSSACRRNAVDARYLRRKKPFSKYEAQDRFNVDEGDQPPMSASNPHDGDSQTAYQKGSVDQLDSEDVWITEYQWWELEVVYKVANPLNGEIEELNKEEFERIIEIMGELDHVRQKVRRYYRAFRVGTRILEAMPLPDDEFTYKVITGKLDRNRGVWYGVVRAMIDPQRLLNKQVSQIQRIIDTNAKGGLLAESDAFEDQQQAEMDWAASDTIVWTKENAVKEGRVIPKPISPYPSGLDKLLAVAQAAIPATSGVNQEMLGLIDREQAGVVDVQRKEAAYGVLKSFFNSLRGYRKLHGRHLLKLIQKYMTDGRLVRIIGRTGNVQYLPLVRDPNTAKFDVIVDEAPTGPNQKDKVFQFLAMFGGPLLSKMNLPPQVMMKFLEFSPLPTALVSEIMQEVQKIPPQQDPKMAEMQGKMQMEQQRLQMDGQRQQADMQMSQMQAQFDAQMEQIKNSTKAQNDNAMNQAKIAMQQAQMEMKAESDRYMAERKAAVMAEEMDMKMRLATWQAEQDALLAQKQFEFEAKMQEREMQFNERMAEKELQVTKSIETKKASTQFGGGVG